jgi:hypothetical protein
MGKQMIDRIKKTTSILLAILFVVSLTAASAGATACGTNIQTMSGLSISSIPSGNDINSFLSSAAFDTGSSDADLNNIWAVIGFDDIFSGTGIDSSWFN